MPENDPNFNPEAELNKIKQDISAISTAIVNAQAKIEVVEELYKKFDAARNGADEHLRTITNLAAESQAQKTLIDNSKNEAEQNLNQIKTTLQGVQTNVQAMKDAYADFQQTKQKVDDPNSGLNVVTAQVQQLKVIVDGLKNEAEQNLNQIKTTLQGVQTNVQAMKDAYADFQQTKQKVDDPATGLNAVFSQAIDLKNKISAAKLSVDETLKAVSITKGQIDHIREDSEVKWNEIVQIKEASDGLKNSISETLDLVTDSSHSNAFIRRKKDIQNETYFWGIGMILSLVGLGVAVLYIYHVQAASPEGFKDWQQWYRYLFTSPLIYLTYVCSHNYNLARNYLERYAFKGVMATTLTSYTKLFKDQFPKAEKEVLNFALETIGSIYKAPYQERDTKRRLYFGFYNVVKGGLQMDDTHQIEKEKTVTKEVTKESITQEGGTSN